MDNKYLQIKKPQNVLLLLSGGKDSHASISVLQETGYTVFALCIDGIQGKEKIGAAQAAQRYEIPLKIVELKYFDEDTWNPLKLILRDLAMGVVAIYIARQNKCNFLATGVKKSDLQNSSLAWLNFFLAFAKIVLRLFGLKMLYPVWDADIAKILNNELTKNAANS